MPLIPAPISFHFFARFRFDFQLSASQFLLFADYTPSAFRCRRAAFRLSILLSPLRFSCFFASISLPLAFATPSLPPAEVFCLCGFAITAALSSAVSSSSIALCFVISSPSSPIFSFSRLSTAFFTLQPPPSLSLTPASARIPPSADTAAS